MDRFWNDDGELVNQYKPLLPVIRQKVFMKVQLPRYFEDFYNDMEGRLRKSPSGKWLFYDRDGELGKMDFEPQVRSNITTRRFENKDYSMYDMEETITPATKSLHLFRSVVMNWIPESTG